MLVLGVEQADEFRMCDVITPDELHQTRYPGYRLKVIEL